MDGSLISVRSLGGETTVQLINPSLRDYLSNRVREDCSRLTTLLRSAIFFEQMLAISTLCAASDHDVTSDLEEALSRLSLVPPMQNVQYVNQDSWMLRRLNFLLAQASDSSTAAALALPTLAARVVECNDLSLKAEAAQMLHDSDVGFDGKELVKQELSNDVVEQALSAMFDLDGVNSARDLLTTLGGLARDAWPEWDYQARSIIETAISEFEVADPDDGIRAAGEVLLALVDEQFEDLAATHAGVLGVLREWIEEDQGDPDSAFDEWRDSQAQDGVDVAIADLFATLRDS
jgi:hypothetical protein